MSVLNVGDKVLWKGTFGMDDEKEVTVEYIEANCVNKSGDEVDSVEWSQVKDRTVIVSLTNGHWAYGNQIRKK